MRKQFLRAAALLTAVLLLPAPVQSFAEEETTSLTVTVYDGDTGELFHVPGVRISIWGNTPEEIEKGTWRSCGAVEWETENPCTVTVTQYHPDWVYNFDLGYNDFGSYWYSIDTERSDVRFPLSADEPNSVSLYLYKKYPESAFDGMFIYRGTYGEEQYPLFEYYYPSLDAYSGYKHFRLCYTGALAETPEYGDVYTTDQPVSPHKEGDINALGNEITITRKGTVSELFETVPMTVVHVNEVSEKAPDTREVLLSDANGKHYWFKTNESDLAVPISLGDARLGDTLDFALYQGKEPLLPLTVPEHAQTIPGDVNFDRDIDSGDIGSLQNLLHGKRSEIELDLSVSDLNGDGETDVFDLAMLKRQVTDELAAKPHITMHLHTIYGGYGVAGQDLGSGSFTTSHTVFGETQFYESYGGLFVKNAVDPFTYMDQILKVERFDEDGVKLTYMLCGEETETVLPYGEELNLETTMYTCDGINYWYNVTFTQDSAKSAE